LVERVRQALSACGTKAIVVQVAAASPINVVDVTMAAPQARSGDWRESMLRHDFNAAGAA
jgi:hypothetical protein